MFTVAGTKSEECPVSFVTERSNELVQIYQRQQILKNAGATFDGDEMPIPLVEAMIVLAQETGAYEVMARENEERESR